MSFSTRTAPLGKRGAAKKKGREIFDLL